MGNKNTEKIGMMIDAFDTILLQNKRLMKEDRREKYDDNSRGSKMNC
jgi:hypothetical protein